MSERIYTENQNTRLNTYRPGRPQRRLLELLRALRLKAKSASRPTPETVNISVQG
jgi:hypothetical protein